MLGLADRKAAGAELVVTGCMAERYGDELRRRAARGRRGGRVRRAGHPRPQARRRAAPQLRPAEPAPPAGRGAVGLREGRRGLRQGLRVLRHPELPRPAALADDRADPRTRSTSSSPAGPRRSCSSRRTSPATGATRASAPRTSCPLVEAVASARRLGAAALPVPVRAHRPAGRRDPRHRRAVLRPLAAARVAPAAAAHAPVGRRRAVPATASTTSAARRPTPRSGRTSSSATPARPRPTTTSCSLRRRRPARLVRLLRLLAGGRHLRRRPRRRRRPDRSSTSGWPSCASSRTPSPRPRRDELVGDGGRGARGRAGRRPQPSRGARDRRHHHRARSTWRVGSLHRVRITGAEGPDSFAEPLLLADAMTAHFGPSALATPANLDHDRPPRPHRCRSSG